MFDEAEITYWIDRKYWGKGITTAALESFFLIEHFRSIHGRVAILVTRMYRSVANSSGSERIRDLQMGAVRRLRSMYIGWDNLSK